MHDNFQQRTIHIHITISIKIPKKKTIPVQIITLRCSDSSFVALNVYGTVLLPTSVAFYECLAQTNKIYLIHQVMNRGINILHTTGSRK